MVVWGGVGCYTVSSSCPDSSLSCKPGLVDCSALQCLRKIDHLRSHQRHFSRLASQVISQSERVLDRQRGELGEMQNACAQLIGGCKGRRAVRIFIPSFIIPLNIETLSSSVTSTLSLSTRYYYPADNINYITLFV